MFDAEREWALPYVSSDGNVTGSTNVAADALDQSRDMIAVIDGCGMIVVTNAAWRIGSELRGATNKDTGCGVNYLDVCEQSNAAHIGNGIRAVLSGAQPRFELDYPCYSPTEDSWWALEASPVGEPGAGAVLTHTNITARINAHWLHGRGRDVDPVTMLSTGPAGVPSLARLLANAQLHKNSMAVVTIKLTNLVEIEAQHGRRCRDDLIVQAAARVLRFTSTSDSMIRPATNVLTLFASVADAQGGQFLRDQIVRAFEASYLVGAEHVGADVQVTVVSSDQFSTIDSLLRELVGDPANPVTEGARAPGTIASVTAATRESSRGATSSDTEEVTPLVVYSLPDGYLQSANQAARALLGIEAIVSGNLHMRDILAPIDVPRAGLALSALGSGATDSYRARRTLATPEGPVALMTSVRRLVVDSGPLAVVLTVPAARAENSTAADDPFGAALIAGTVDGNGTVTSVSTSGSPMETELALALTGPLRQAVHPHDTDAVDRLVSSVRLQRNAFGTLRLPHSEQGWVTCQCQMFTIRRPVVQPSNTSTDPTDRESFVFVLSASVSTRAMSDKIVRLERHIRRIGSEVHAADVELTAPATGDRGMAAVLDRLELTARQRDIVERLAQGQRVASIATALYISRSTVRNHLAQVYQLVGVHSQEELLIALRAS